MKRSIVKQTPLNTNDKQKARLDTFWRTADFYQKRKPRYAPSASVKRFVLLMFIVIVLLLAVGAYLHIVLPPTLSGGCFRFVDNGTEYIMCQ
jgi:hypothetical protein